MRRFLRVLGWMVLFLFVGTLIAITLILVAINVIPVEPPSTK